jgi:hypothetical protein
MQPTLALAALALAAQACPPATVLAQPTVIHAEDFESGATSGWLANGLPTIEPFGGSPPGSAYLSLPLGDFFGFQLRNQTPGFALTGDLTRHAGPIEFDFDLTVITSRTFGGMTLDPEAYPLIFEFVDYGPTGSIPVSVYLLGPPMPAEGSGWARFSFVLPDPTQLALPPGWGGTGDEDPRTGEPRLPPGRTYTSVLRNVDEVRVSTFRPGWFYGFNFWEVGWDNIEARVPAGACRVDLNADGVIDFNDLLVFLNLYNTQDPRADFNHDGVIDFNDLLVFLNEYNAGC